VPDKITFQRDALLKSSKNQYQIFGFQKMTIERCIDKAELSKTVFYKHFSSKFELIETLLIEESKIIAYEIVNAINQVEEKSVINCYIASVKVYFLWCISNRKFCLKVLDELYNPDSPVPKVRRYTIGLLHENWNQICASLSVPQMSLLEADSIARMIERYIHVYLEQENDLDYKIFNNYLDSLLKVSIPIINTLHKN
jgi:AcrR family transcriptional regulator